MAQMTTIEGELVKKVLEVAGDNEAMVRSGIIAALEGIDDRARRTYLWNLLDRKARQKIRRVRKVCQHRLAGA